ncbi:MULTISPECIES: YbaN family protein [unclassified Motilimonas]|uniref:YbaN family protein n=1 Tax=Motilimonas TaxID=1914248 RepID=UPI001E4839C4|nr:MULTISPECIES: YbaN family protein [unclassified Motilimonas]MCE0556376.1 YbaN family protein [Motilimonas sp. E26]MDO6525854.1 YbaN family protein [Motilimonas sp. 1_MG-2023]
MLKRPFYFVLGSLAFVLGLIGIPLPVLPTTPFILLAAFCFAKSSPRFHQALLNHQWFGPMIKNWQRDRSIAKTTKRKALLMMSCAFAISIYWAPLLWIKAILVVCFLCLFFWMLSLKET